MIIKNYLTQDKRLVIYQDIQLNSFTMDSLLLFKYVRINKKDKYIVDLCAGNGPVTMLMSDLVSENTNIYGIEIQKKIYKLAVKSIRENKLKNITFLNNNLITINKVIGQNKFDIVTCNPPYFKVEQTSKLNTNESVSISRHELEVNLEQILKESKTLLKNDGRIVMVHRPERLNEIIIKLNKYNFHLKRLQFVYPKIGKEANTILFEAKKGKEGKLRIDPPLFIYDENGYTKEAKKILDIEK